jgi:hypothetical protein
MLVNLLFTGIYLMVGGGFAFAAWTGIFDVPAVLLWVGAGFFLIVGLWRLLHLSKG